MGWQVAWKCGCRNCNIQQLEGALSVSHNYTTGNVMRICRMATSVMALTMPLRNLE